MEPNNKLWARIVFILTRAGVPENEAVACLEWAFGRGCLKIAPCDWPKRWNKLHSNAPRLKGKDKVVELLTMVGVYYVLQKEKARITQSN